LAQQCGVGLELVEPDYGGVQHIRCRPSLQALPQRFAIDISREASDLIGVLFLNLALSYDVVHKEYDQKVRLRCQGIPLPSAAPRQERIAVNVNQPVLHDATMEIDEDEVAPDEFNQSRFQGDVPLRDFGPVSHALQYTDTTIEFVVVD
jgi:hypothetical protein